jgi:hypothetical protein
MPLHRSGQIDSDDYMVISTADHRTILLPNNPTPRPRLASTQPQSLTQGLRRYRTTSPHPMLTIQPNRLSKPPIILLTDIDRGGIATRYLPLSLSSRGRGRLKRHLSRSEQPPARQVTGQPHGDEQFLELRLDRLACGAGVKVDIATDVAALHGVPIARELIAFAGPPVRRIVGRP